ncbi:MAG: hypothetical protein Q9201_007350 [Fulgogasparrea decipioides]
MASQPDQQVGKGWTEEELETALLLKDFLAKPAELLQHLNNRFGKNRTLCAVSTRIQKAKDPHDKFHDTYKTHRDRPDGEAIKRLGKLLAKRVISDSGTLRSQDDLMLGTAPVGSSSAEASTAQVTTQTHNAANKPPQSSPNDTDNNGVSEPSVQTSNDATSSTTDNLPSVPAPSPPERKIPPRPFSFFEDAFFASMYDDADGGYY